MQRFTQTVGRQFGRPRGPLGWIVARFMRRGNAPLNLGCPGFIDLGLFT